MSEYANGADGFCCECGDETEEEWHAYCAGCYAEQHRWRRPDADALARQHHDRQRVMVVQLVARLGELEIRIRRLERERRVAA